ncbi:unnamed protein product [Polarella glacialis]|uniref:Uncharacterized protein n=1 Tax=Polarella glacialis TaxID=89957 RepID=A0A813H5H2_POLGL|nr:unnamed protein product [Polarella glacialis]
MEDYSPLQLCKECLADLGGAMPAFKASSETLAEITAEFGRVRDARLAAILAQAQLFFNPWYARALLHMDNNAVAEMGTVSIVSALMCSFVAALVMDPPDGASWRPAAFSC